MAIVFTQQKRSRQILIAICLLAIIITVIIFWQVFFKQETPTLPAEVFLPPKEIKINFEIFEQPILKELLPFIEIEPFKEVPPTEVNLAGIKLGRENPFLLY